MKKNITVGVICFNEERNIENCLISITSQTLKPSKIVVVDNNSIDTTREIIAGLQKKHKNIILKINHIRNIAVSRNMVLETAHTPLIAFTDADCIAPSDWLEKLYTGFILMKKNDDNIVAVGGNNLPPDKSLWFKTLRLLLDSFLGTGSSIQGRVFNNNRIVPHIPTVNILSERQVLLKEGGYDRKLGNIIEDEDMSTRLANHGYKLAYINNCPVIHFLSENIFEWMGKMVLYGKGRVLFSYKYPKKVNIKFLAPLILILSFPLLSFNSFLFYLIFIPYLSIVLIFALLQGFKYQKLYLTPSLYFLYIITHLSYGVGEIVGIAAIVRDSIHL